MADAETTSRSLGRSVSAMVAIILNRLTWYLFLIIGFMVFIYVPWLLFHIPFVVVVVGGLTSCAAIIWIALDRQTRLSREVDRNAKDKNRLSFISILFIGVTLRVVYVCLVPPIQLSDALFYWNTAQHLLETGIYYYELNGYILRAWLPPGYPFFLSACMALVGHNPWVPAFTNICFYILTSIFVYSVAKRLAEERVARSAILFVALWPSYIAITGLAMTEPLFMSLYISALWALLKSIECGWRYAFVAGGLIGLGALVRPVLLAFPAVWVLFILMNRHKCRITFQKIAVAAVSMVLVIMPWSVRNYLVIGKFILISTNGGHVFYRANNPLAFGGWTTHGEKNLDIHLNNEVELNQKGYAWGVDWIKKNPLGFLKLAIKKQGLLLGEDTTGVYWSLERGHGNRGKLYQGLRAISNLWWIGMWALAMIGVIRWRSFFARDPKGGLLLWMVLFFVVIHSIFESQARYHIPFISILSILSALAFRPPKYLDLIKNHSGDR